jgi:hypothetical protein
MAWLDALGQPGLHGVETASLPLYGIHLVDQWPPDAPVILTEGEKCADCLIAIGVPAVGTVTGAFNTPSYDTLADLAGRHVFLWPDNDDAGRRHMAAIAERLRGIADVSIIDWQDAPPKGGADDFFADGRGADDVRALLSKASPARRAWRTLADIDDAPPDPLLLGMYEPNGPNLAYAAPGVGKGTTGAWVIVECQRLGKRVAIYDAERRPNEWSRRVSGLGGDRSEVVYIAPEDLGSEYFGRPLWEVAPAIGRIMTAAGVDLLIVDSILPAIGVGEDRLRSDAQAPYLYVQALDALGKPSLSFGHPPKGQPEGEPFGSMAWGAAMRMTWLGTRGEGDGHRVRWRPRKRNERGYIPGVLLSFEYGDDGRPRVVTREDDEQTTRVWLLTALADRDAHSVADLADDLLADQPDHVTADATDRVKERLSRALRRMAADGVVLRDGKTRHARWRLA